MANLHYTISINAPKEKVWHTMLDQETYRKWTGAFMSGSYFEGSWDKGSQIQFVSDEDQGKSGMMGEIAENIPYEYISIRSIAEIVDGQEDTTSESALSWIGSFENYHFAEADGMTTVDVELIGDGINDEIKMMFDGMWPKGLAKLKEIAESA